MQTNAPAATQPLTDFVLEFVDSEVRDVVRVGHDLIVTFAAAYVRPVSHALGTDSGAGYLSALSLSFRRAEHTGDLPSCQGRVAAGELDTAGARLNSTPLPYLASSPVSARLQFANGTQLSIQAASAECRPTGEEKFVESYVCWCV